LEVTNMTGYRSRATKPCAALWLLIVLADAGWAATTGTAAALGTVALLTMAGLVVLAVRLIPPAERPVRARAHRIAGPYRPSRLPHWR
jgi:hypothetical protein